MKNIFLVGMPSSGKTTLGKAIADALHYHFIDTDKVIVREENRSIARIFAESGEAYFRDVEAQVLRRLQPGHSLVVATGGGMPCFHDNMQYINANGLSVFLDVPIHVLVQRMRAHGLPDRPLNRPDDPELVANLTQRHTSRLPIYSQAHLHISGETGIDELLRRIGEHL